MLVFQLGYFFIFVSLVINSGQTRNLLFVFSGDPLGNRGRGNNCLFKDSAHDSSHKCGKNPKQISTKVFKQVK